MCYSCGGQAKCDNVSGCTSYSNLSTNEIGQPYSTLYVGCLGVSFCVVPSNGVLVSQTDGSTFGFINYMSASNDEMCSLKLDPTYCGEWEATATTYYNFPFYRCAATGIQTADLMYSDTNPCDACEKGYYLENGKCSKCPTSGGIEGTTSGLTYGGITRCYIPAGFSFSDSIGSGTYSADCYYTE